MRWLIRRSNARGEWTVADRLRDYRVCAYNEGAHGAPHLHHPLDGPDLGHAGVESAMQAERVMRWYAKEHDHFDAAAFAATVRAWKSASKRC